MEERLNVNEQQIKKLEEELNNEVDSKKQIELKLNEVEKYLLYVSLFCQCWVDLLVVIEYFFCQVEDEKKSFEEKMGQYEQKQKVTIDY